MRTIPIDAFLLELSVLAADAEHGQTWIRGGAVFDPPGESRYHTSFSEIYAMPGGDTPIGADVVAESIYLPGHAAHIVATQPKAILALVERVRVLLEFAQKWSDNMRELAAGARAAHMPASADAFSETAEYLAKLLAPIEVP